MKFMSSRYLLILALVLYVCSSSACYLEGEGFGDTVEKSFQVSKGGNLIVQTDIGAIEVRSGQDDRVRVKVIQKARANTRKKARRILKDFVLDMQQRGNDVIINGDYKRHKHWFSWFRRNRLRIRFEITVPPVYNVNLRTSGGSISVSNLEGQVESRTSGGSLHFGMINGPVFGKTSGGSIRLKGCVGDAEVRTSGGSITIGKVEGEVDAHTSGGSIRVEEVMGSIQASTSGGSIKASVSKQPEGDCRLTTSGGTIRLYLAEDIKLNIDARTSGGRVRTDFPVTLEGELSRRKLYGKINGGGPEFYLRTSGGSIYIKRFE
ncbi:MAG: DUF4097 family beta strand repeat protein [Candidatus Aminicenantes bacterium]|nr:DUF4097 family beta strand repeat protein [Candidatus Aminicenantes bacterium]